MKIKNFIDWRNKNRKPKIEDRFYTVDLWKYLDLNIGDEVEEISVDKVDKNFSVNIKFSTSFIDSCKSGLLPSIKDPTYRFNLNVNDDNKVITIQMSRPPYQLDHILDSIASMIRKYLTDNSAIEIRYRSSDTGPR